MMMIDTHAHIHDAKFDADRSAVLQRAREAGVEKIITVGTSIVESQEAVRCAAAYKDVFATVGLHPHVFNGGQRRAQEWEEWIGADNPEDARRAAMEKAIIKMRELARSSAKVIAIGEVGLDYHSHAKTSITAEQKAWQKEGFLKQAALAQELRLPLIIHCRSSAGNMPARNDSRSDSIGDVYEDMFDILRGEFPKDESHKLKAVLHCYGGNIAVTEKFLSLENVYFSFAGNVTFAKRDTDEINTVIRMIPEGRILLETDCPYLAPTPHRGERNEPLYVCAVGEHIAALRGEATELIASHTTRNAQDVFGI